MGNVDLLHLGNLFFNYVLASFCLYICIGFTFRSKYKILHKLCEIKVTHKNTFRRNPYHCTLYKILYTGLTFKETHKSTFGRKLLFMYSLYKMVHTGWKFKDTYMSTFMSKPFFLHSCTSIVVGIVNKQKIQLTYNLHCHCTMGI